MRIGPALDVCVSSSWARSLLGGFLVVARFRSGDGGGCFSVLRLSVLVGARARTWGSSGSLLGFGVNTIPNFARCWSFRSPWCVNFGRPSSSRTARLLSGSHCHRPLRKKNISQQLGAEIVSLLPSPISFPSTSGQEPKTVPTPVHEFKCFLHSGMVVGVRGGGALLK